MSDELPSELRNLFDAERAAPGPHPGARARVHGRVLASLGLVAAGETAAAAAGTSAATTTTAAAATGITKLVVVSVFVAATVGGGTAWILRDGPGPRTEMVSAPVVPSQPRVSVRPTEPAITPPPVAAPPVVQGNPPRAEARAPSPPRRARESQQALLKRALAAVASAELSTALAVLEQDASLHANGSLAEEREALRIDVLLRLARRDEAQTRARAFLQRFPASIHREAVGRALVEKP